MTNITPILVEFKSDLPGRRRIGYAMIVDKASGMVFVTWRVQGESWVPAACLEIV